MKTPILIALAGLLISSAQTAEPTGTLALACQGTTDQWGEQSTSTMHLTVNLSTGTVGGFRDDADIFYGVTITTIDDEIVRFRGAEISGEDETYVHGFINRISGDAHDAITRPRIRPIAVPVRNHSLKCKPTAVLGRGLGWLQPDSANPLGIFITFYIHSDR